MKRIYLIRHAKTIKNSNNIEIVNKKEILEMFKKISEKIKIDVLLSSPARRCQKSAELISDIFKFNGKISYKKELAKNQKCDILDILSGIDAKDIFIISHKANLVGICETLINCVIDNIPSCGILAIEMSKSSNKVLFFINHNNLEIFDTIPSFKD